VAFTPGNGAAEAGSMFLARMTAHPASAQPQRHWIGVPTAHASALTLTVAGDIRSPFVRGPPGLTLCLPSGFGARGTQFVPLDGTATERASWEVRPTSCLIPR
jgi:hypothetical protein